MCKNKNYLKNKNLLPEIIQNIDSELIWCSNLPKYALQYVCLFFVSDKWSVIDRSNFKYLCPKFYNGIPCTSLTNFYTPGITFIKGNFPGGVNLIHILFGYRRLFCNRPGSPRDLLITKGSYSGFLMCYHLPNRKRMN